MNSFRRSSVVYDGDREMTDVIGIKTINAKTSKTTTVTVAGKGMKFRSLSSRKVALV